MTTRDGGPAGVAASGSLRVLYRYAQPHRAALLGVLLLSLLAGAAGLALPLIAQGVLDSLASGEGVLDGVLLAGGLLVGGAGLTGLNSWLQQRTSERVVRHLRWEAVFRLIRLRVSELDNRPPGDLVARVTSDSVLLKSAVTDGFILVVNGALTLVAAIVLMASLHLGLLGVTAAVFVGVAALLTMVLPRIREAVARTQGAVGSIGAALDRALGAARTVKANGTEQRETALANAAIDEAYQAGLVAARHTAVVTVISGASVQASFLVVLGVGGMLAASGSLSLSSLIAFLLYVFYLATPINFLINGARTLQQGLGAAGRIEEIRSMPIEEDVDVVVADGEPAGTPPRIEVRDLTFSYPDRSPALRGVSFTVPAGCQTAIVGLSGAGKTTLFSLLQRFYDPDSGSIRVDGAEITTLSRAELRHRIAYVEQDAPVLAGTIRDNLLYAAPDATPVEIAATLRATRLERFVHGLDSGLDTTVGPRGITLSGGERQRLAIARALLRRPQVLLLDEATAQLDARNEQALRDVIAGVAEHCTVIVIAHRLSTVTDADQILVLENGVIRARGRHATLIANDELYRELATTQLLTDEIGAETALAQ